MTATIRPFENADLAGVIDLLAVAMPADPIPESRFIRQVLLDPNFRAQGAPVAVHDGRIAGFCLSLARQVPLENAPSDADRGYITLFAVAPQAQRQGVGTALIRAAEEYLKSQNRKLVMVSSYAPGYFIPGVDVAAYAPALSFFAKHGYKEVHRPLAMQTSLWDFATPDWVNEKERELVSQGVTITHYTPDLTLPLLEFTRQEFPGDWMRVVREGMGRIAQGDPPQRLFIAHEGGKVLGFSHHDHERFGPIGVAKSQRGRCIGQVLMFRTLHAQRQAGFRAAWFLWSGDETAARLYNVAGFKEIRRFALLKKEL
jgi:mycothiol synthase